MKVTKFLIPAVAGLMISPALMAADIDTPSTTRTFSNEFLSTAGAADFVFGDVLAVELGSEYAITDQIQLTFTGDALDEDTLPASVTGAAAGKATLTFGLLSGTNNSATYRVTEIDTTAGTSTVGSIVTFAGADVLKFDATAASTSGVDVIFSANILSGAGLDTGGGDLRSTEYIATDDQFEAEVTVAFNQIVDVDTDRKMFVAGTDDVGEMDLTDVGGFFMDATFVDSDVTWTGDFGSWIVDDDDATDGIQLVDPSVVVVAPGTCTSVEITAMTISYTCTTLGATTLTLDPTLNLDGGDLQILPATPYTVAVDANYTGIGGGDGKVSFGPLDAGAWTLNGYQALIPYMPYGVGIGQVIYLANRGTQSGAVSVEWVDKDGTSGSLGEIANLGATTTLALGPIIKAALPEAQQEGGRLALTVTANVPAADVQMNSQYNASGNRAFTLHEDNRP